MVSIPGLRNKEVCSMYRWGLMELKCVSLWAHICYMYYLKNTTKEERNYIIIYIYIYISKNDADEDQSKAW